MINIRNTFIKEKYKSEGCVIISNALLAESYAQKVLLELKGNFVLDKPYLLSIFIAAIKFYKNDAQLINCNSSEDRLLNDLYEIDSNDLCIYYNVNGCNNTEILDKIKNNPCVLCL